MTLEFAPEVQAVFDSYASAPLKLFYEPRSKVQVSLDNTTCDKDRILHIDKMMPLVLCISSDANEILARQNVMDVLLSDPDAANNLDSLLMNKSFALRSYSFLQTAPDEEMERCKRIAGAIPRSAIKIWIEELKQSNKDINSAAQYLEAGADTTIRSALERLEETSKATAQFILELSQMQHPFFQSLGKQLLPYIDFLNSCTAEKYLEAYLSNDKNFFAQLDQIDGFFKSQINPPAEGLIQARRVFQSEEYCRTEFVDTLEEAGYEEGWNFVRKYAKSSINGELNQVTNDSMGNSKLIVVSGSNMSGKSFGLEQTLFMQMVGQAFGYAPATSAKVFARDRIFFIERGTTDFRHNLSSFGKDHLRWNNALTGITPRTLIIGDELFSSASPEDQARIAYGISHYGYNNGAQLILAIHSEEYMRRIAQVPEMDPQFVHLETIFEGKDVKYTHKLKSGVDQSHAIEVARSLGIDEKFIRLVEQYLEGTLPPASPNPKGFPEIVPYSDDEREVMKLEVGSLRTLVPWLNEYEVLDRDGGLGPRVVTRYDSRNDKWDKRPKLEVPTGILIRTTKVNSHRSQGLLDHRELMHMNTTTDVKSLLERQRFYAEISSFGLLDQLLSARSKITRSIAEGYYLESKIFQPDFYKKFLSKLLTPQSVISMMTMSSMEGNHPLMVVEAVKMACELGQLDTEALGVQDDITLLEKLLEQSAKDQILRTTKPKKTKDQTQEEHDLEMEAWYAETDGETEAVELNLVELARADGFKVKDYGDGQLYVDLYKFIERVQKRISKKIMDELPDLDIAECLSASNVDRNHEILSRYSARFQELEAEVASHYKKTFKNEFTTTVMQMAAIFEPELPHVELCNLLRQHDSVYAHQLANYFEMLVKASFHGFDSMRDAFAQMFVETDESWKRYHPNTKEFVEEQYKFAHILWAAETIRDEGYCKVDFNPDGRIDVDGGINPFTDNEDQVPNDIHIGGDAQRYQLVTGSNMSGKSNYLAELVSIPQFAQSTGFIKAQSASLPIFNNVILLDRPKTYTDVELSSFGVDVTRWDRAFQIIQKRGGTTLFCVDEGFSTTSPYFEEAFSVAAVVKLMRLKVLGAFASHNHNAIDALIDLMPEQIAAVHLGASITDEGTVEFTHKLQDGHGQSLGLEVAETLGGFPGDVLQVARTLELST